MIQFPCRCGHQFSVSDDEAGGLVQCPECRRLNDIPLPSELASLAADGTFNLDVSPVKTEAERLDDLAYIYHGGRRDDAGDDIDLRTTAEELAHVGDDYSINPGAPDARRTPKYDPVTGELIREIEVKADDARDTDPAAIPLARPAIGYRTAKVARADHGRVSPGMIPVELFRPQNLLVMFCVFVTHFMLNVVLVVLASGIFILLLAPLALIFLLLGHYAVVVDEIGPTDRDELPRPLRSLAWGDDLWGPFCATMAALVLCYGPAIGLPVALAGRPAAVPLLIVLGVVGSFFFPAVFLTTAASGSAHNLRPDRVLGVIGRCGGGYLVAAAVFLLAAAVYVTGIAGGLIGILRLFELDTSALPRVLTSGYAAYGLLAAGIYLMHLFSWRVGLLYRRHQPEFPWVLQYHQRKTPPAAVPPASPFGREKTALINAQLAAAQRGKPPARHPGPPRGNLPRL